MRLIDKDEVKEKVGSYYKELDKLVGIECSIIEIDVLNIITTMPTEDVVRCKDCKYYTQFGCKPTHIDENNEDVTLAMEDDDFCSRGEKKWEE